MSKIVIAGGSGFLGGALAVDLAARGHEVVVLTRGAASAGSIRRVQWDGVSLGRWADELAGDDVRVVNLAGKLVDCRPTAKNIAALRDSRVNATLALTRAAADRPVRAWLQSSTTAIWSDAGERAVTESTPVPTGAAALPQMTGVAVPWEEAARGANAGTLRVLRTSIVLAPNTPAYDRLAMLARFGLGGTVGSGRQWFSWIHLDDWLAIARAALGVGEFALPEGVVAATAPHPVRNADLMRELRERLAPRVLGRALGVPTPAPLLKLGAIALRTDAALALTSRRVTSDVLDGRYAFRYPTLSSALDQVTGEVRRSRQLGPRR